MSFSVDVKSELVGLIDAKRHCQLAELAAILSAEARFEIRQGKSALVFQSENAFLSQKYQALLQRVFLIEAAEAADQLSHIIRLEQSEQLRNMLMALKIMDVTGHIVHPNLDADGLLLQQSCCKRAFIRGAFLAYGSISNPEKSYHFEIVCVSEDKAKILQKLLCDFDLDAKIVQRKKHFVVYLKEGAQIVDVLNIMGAHIALMNLENLRIVKEMRNSVNRKVNCETANINKIVNASVRQIEAIKYIQAQNGWDELPENLQEMARVRLEYPDASLLELGELCEPAVGKSGVNHRLRKLCELAEKMGLAQKES